ncbi:5'-3' exoribonuclease 2, partial [Dictyocoela roeselum]
MGVPSLFRWLTNKYPTIISSPVPNKVDNLYLDFNAIIHSACHPTDGPTPDSEDQMLRNISAILDTIMAKIRPRKMLFISIDGVAPRAKLNQQRARRYKTAMDVEKSGKKYFAREPA